MKTSLKQQLELINAIEKEPSKPSRILLLRKFLDENGYEDKRDCTHAMIMRISGRCASCGTVVMEAQPRGSEEAVQALRDRLRD